MKIGETYRTKVDLRVTCCWENDPLAGENLLDATLPAGETILVCHIPDAATAPIQCTLLNHKDLLHQMIPKKYRSRILGISLPTPFDVLVARKDLQQNCEPTKTEPNPTSEGIRQSADGSSKPSM